VNIKHYKPLHYVLIILLMLAPLRSVMAVEQAPCDMADMDMEKTSMSMPVMDHDMSSHEMSSDHMQVEQSAATHQCCCCDSDCLSGCDMGMTASLFIQASVFTPVFINTSSSPGFNSEILARALTPPSRPPANLS
jgi:hypothetical protein